MDLAEFQEDAVKKARRILARYDGALIADSVGLARPGSARSCWKTSPISPPPEGHRRLPGVAKSSTRLRNLTESTEDHPTRNPASRLPQHHVIRRQSKEVTGHTHGCKIASQRGRSMHRFQVIWTFYHIPICNTSRPPSSPACIVHLSYHRHIWRRTCRRPRRNTYHKSPCLRCTSSMQSNPWDSSAQKNRLCFSHPLGRPDVGDGWSSAG